MGGRNCWEVKQCGRQVGGPKAHELGVCSAATTARANGLNGGRNGGRACSVVTGTICGGKQQGVFLDKMANCRKCEFFLSVRREEGAAYVDTRMILEMLSVPPGT